MTDEVPDASAPEISPQEGVGEVSPPAEPAAAEPAPEVEPPAPEPQPSVSAPAPIVAPTPISNWKSEYQAKGLAKTKQKVEQHLAAILAEAKKKKQITNRDVVKLLRISDATASRYLKMLVARGQVQKSGRGRSVVYSI